MEESLCFTVMGEPVGKGRPRFSRAGKGVRTYTPKKTAEYETEVQRAFMALGKPKFCKGEPIRMHIDAYYGPPKSISKIKAKKMISGELKPIKKPDLDNVIKIIADALNGIAYEDDTQLVEVHAVKQYGGVPRVCVSLMRAE